ncbi:MAG TPA: AsmA family protein, partial [Terriglobales bacterium]|nr:AsmA family protein [Terriglobales bacterium]
MRKSGIILGIAASLIVLVVLVVPAFVDINQYRPKIEAELQKALGRQVSVGPMRLSLLPPRARVSNVVIAEDPNYGTGPFISVPEMSASIDVWALLKGEMKLQSLTLKQPSVQLVHTKSGVWNFSSLGGKQSGNKDTQGTGAVPLSNIEISDGHVTLIDQQKNFRGSYEQIDLSVEGYAPNQAFDVDAGMVLPGKGAGKLQLQGKIGPIQPNDIMSTPVNGELKLQEVSIASLQALTNQQQDMALNGTASGKISVRNNGRELESSGEMKVDKLSVRGVQVDYPIALEYKLSGNLNDHNFKVEGGKLSLGPTPFGFSGTLNAAPTPMTVDMSLSTKDAPLAEAARLAAAFGVAFGTQVNVAGQLTADVQARGPVNSPALNGSVVARNISVRGGELKQPVEVPEIQLALTPAAIRSNSFTASSAGTKLQVQFGLTNYTSPAPQVDAQLRTSKAQVGELIAMANAYGVEAAQGMSGSGEANLDVHASGPLKDANALSFSGSGQLGNVTLHTQSLKQPLKVTRADLKFTQNSVAVQNFTAALGSTNASGNLTLGNFAAPRVQFALNADQFNVTELQQIMASAGQSEPAAWTVVERAAAKKQAEPSILTRMTGQGKVTIGKILYDKLVLTNVRSDVQMDHGIIKLAPLNASLFGG